MVESQYMGKSLFGRDLLSLNAFLFACVCPINKIVKLTIIATMS